MLKYRYYCEYKLSRWFATWGCHWLPKTAAAAGPTPSPRQNARNPNRKIALANLHGKININNVTYVNAFAVRSTLPMAPLTTLRNFPAESNFTA